MRIRKGDVEIRTLKEWRQHAPPQRKNQWAPARSAMCMAKAWLESAPPASVRGLLESHAEFDRLEFAGAEAEPECEIHFDGYGGPRHADLAFLLRDSRGVITVTVEGKADEPFGSYAADVLGDPVDRGLGRPSNGVRRVQALAASLLPPRTPGPGRPTLPPLRKLRYQLMTAAAGSLAYAAKSNAERTVLIIEEFVTGQTEDRLHERNRGGPRPVPGPADRGRGEASRAGTTDRTDQRSRIAAVLGRCFTIRGKSGAPAPLKVRWRRGRTHLYSAPGISSPNTQLAFWTLDRLNRDGGLVPGNLLQEFAGRRVLGIGHTVRAALPRYTEEHRPWQEAGLRSV